MRMLMYLFLLLAVIGIVFGKTIDGKKAARDVRQGGIIPDVGESIEELVTEVVG